MVETAPQPFPKLPPPVLYEGRSACSARPWAHALGVGVLGAKVAALTVLPFLREGLGSLLFTGGGLALQPSPD